MRTAIAVSSGAQVFGKRFFFYGLGKDATELASMAERWRAPGGNNQIQWSLPTTSAVHCLKTVCNSQSVFRKKSELVPLETKNVEVDLIQTTCQSF